MRGRGSLRFTNGGELLRRPSSYRKLLGRVAFRTLLDINDGAPLWKYVERLEVIGLMVVILMVFFSCNGVVLIF